MAIAKTEFYMNTAGHVLALGIPEDIYMRDYAEHFCEWVDGTVIKMSPVYEKHDEITQYLTILFNAYFELRPTGKIRLAPFVMCLQLEDKRTNRESDLQIILNSNPNSLTPTYMDGAADIVIEIVSQESIQRDYAEKFHEYEQAGVSEYWIIDPLKKDVRFYRLNSQDAYILQEVEDVYITPCLPDLQFHISTLWQMKLPGTITVAKQVLEMLGK